VCCHNLVVKDKHEFRSQDIEDCANSLEFFIPYYNSYNYLVECLLSLASQDLPNFKVTIIDDGSSDNRAGQFIEEMQDSRFLYIRNSHNIGLPRNFQKCVESATSDWVIILGQDDVLPHDFVKSLFSHLGDLTVGFIQPRVEIIDSRGKISKNSVDSIKSIIRKCMISNLRRKNHEETGKLRSASILPWFLIGNPFYFPTIVWNRARLQEFGFRQDLSVTLDYELIFRFLNNNSSVLFIEDATAYYRRHDASASGKMSSMLQRLEEEMRVTKSFKNDLINSSILINSILIIRPTIRCHALVIAFLEMKSRNFRSSLRYASEAFKY